MNTTDTVSGLSPALIALLKGVTYQDENPALWQTMLELQSRVRDYVSTLGLELILDEGEGYAYLRQRVAAEGDPELPRLVPRRQLSYPVSLLLALLRKKLAEFDATSGDTRLIVSREEIAEMIRVFQPDAANEARLMNRLDTDIKRVVEMGFLRQLRGNEDKFELRRILKAFVDAQWLSEFEKRLAEYREVSALERS
jgi:hypothetical protein